MIQTDMFKKLNEAKFDPSGSIMSSFVGKTVRLIRPSHYIGYTLPAGEIGECLDFDDMLEVRFPKLNRTLSVDPRAVEIVRDIKESTLTDADKFSMSMDCKDLLLWWYDPKTGEFLKSQKKDELHTDALHRKKIKEKDTENWIRGRVLVWKGRTYLMIYANKDWHVRLPSDQLNDILNNAQRYVSKTITKIIDSNYDDISDLFESNLEDHAKDELARAGLFDQDSDYGGMLADAVMMLVKAFADQGHSGCSAEMATQLFNKLSRFENLTPITDNPEEWMNCSEYFPEGKGTWQCRRNPALFSNDGGKTHYSVDDEERKIINSEPYAVGMDISEPEEEPQIVKLTVLDRSGNPMPMAESAETCYHADAHLSGDEAAVKKALSFLNALSTLGKVGHSCHMFIGWDGDGSDRMDVQSNVELEKLNNAGFGEIKNSLSAEDLRAANESKEDAKIMGHIERFGKFFEPVAADKVRSRMHAYDPRMPGEVDMKNLKVLVARLRDMFPNIDFRMKADGMYITLSWEDKKEDPIAV